MRDKTTYVGIELKVQGGGVIAGFYNIVTYITLLTMFEITLVRE